MKRTTHDSPRLRELIDQLNTLVEQRARTALTGERAKYLASSMEGVPVEQLPLDSDDILHELEVTRAKLMLDDPVRNAVQIEELEE